MELTTRNATLADLAQLLQEQQVHKLDMIVPADRVRAVDGTLVIAGVDPVIDENGVTVADGYYTPTVVCDNAIAGKLNIPPSYLARCRNNHTRLYDENVNGWLEWDRRSFLVRCFKGEGPGSYGIARAFLSDQYKMIDNLDVLTSALDGIRESGINCQVVRCDLTEKSMYVTVHAPDVQVLSPTLLEGYRSPFSGNTGADNPVVFAGFVLSNSEVGLGAYSIAPQIIVQVCTNGMTITKDVFRAVHLGSKMDEGVVRWGIETQEKNLGLIRSQTKDFVQTFLDREYVARKVREFEDKKGERLENPAKQVQEITNRLKFSQEHTASVLNYFIDGGDNSRWGVVQAITAVAQTVDDADEQFELESVALKALDV